jgi:hypothetical protein
MQSAGRGHWFFEPESTDGKGMHMKWKESIEGVFQGTVPFSQLEERARSALGAFSLTPDNTLFANVTCRDEINKPSVEAFARYWGENFDLAGLGGYPSAGITGFTAYAHHVPDGGNLFILYGPHIGVNETGKLGRVTRPGLSHESAACGALMGFVNKVLENRSYLVRPDPLDREQNILEESLLSSMERIVSQPDPIVPLTEQMYRIIEDRVLEILTHIHFDRQIVLLGGLHINTPRATDDLLAVRRADVLNADNIRGKTVSWLEQLL